MPLQVVVTRLLSVSLAVVQDTDTAPCPFEQHLFDVEEKKQQQRK